MSSDATGTSDYEGELAVLLEPGDIIATGTPAGVGIAHTPPTFLIPGDKVEITITGIGTLYNPIV